MIAPEGKSETQLINEALSAGELERLTGTKDFIYKRTKYQRMEEALAELEVNAYEMSQDQLHRAKKILAIQLDKRFAERKRR
jgi:hypothetical protein